jgi:predicted DNA-binding ribbon-helix-helix protein
MERQQIALVVTLTELLTRIDGDRYTPNLSSAIRLFVLEYHVKLASRKTDDQATKQ